MTKRNFCERLLLIYNEINSLQIHHGEWNEWLSLAQHDIRKAIINLVAPEEK